MSTVVDPHRLGEPVYQILAPPPRVASEAKVPASIKMEALKRIPLRSFGRTTPTTLVYPSEGVISRYRARLRSLIASVTRVALYAATLAVLAVSFAGFLAASGWTVRGPLPVLLILGLIALWAEHHSVRISENLSMTVSVLPALFGAAVYGPLDAMAIAAFGLLAEVGRPHARWVVWISHRSIGAGVAGLLIWGIASDAPLGRFAVVVAAAAAAEALIDAFFGLVTLTIRKSGSRLAVLRSLAPIVIATVPLYAPVIVLLSYGHTAFGPWVLALFLAPVVGVQALYRLYNREKTVARELKDTNARLERANISFASALVSTLDARDAYTAGHSAAVAVYSRDIAVWLGLPEGEQRLAHLAGLLHDVGKVGLPAGLLEKPALLTANERKIMERHSEIGEHILRRVGDYAMIATIVRHHHEHMDGRGYPDGLSMATIPLVSRIISVADAYNAMTSGRPYRSALSTAEARARLVESAGTQFDPSIVAAFEAILTESSTKYIRGVRADFALDAQWSRLPVSLPRLCALEAS